MKAKLSAIYTVSIAEFEQLEFIIKNDVWINDIEQLDKIKRELSQGIEYFMIEDDDSKSKRATRLKSSENFEAAFIHTNNSNDKPKNIRELSTYHQYNF
jgi:hypothetical protein